MAKSGYVYEIGVGWINANLADLLRIFKAHMGPCLARVYRFVNAVAMGGVAADRTLTGAHVDHIVVGGGHRDRSDRTEIDLPIGDWFPRVAAVGRLEDAAACAAEVVNERLTRDARYSVDTAAAEGADLAKFEDVPRDLFRRILGLP